MKQNNNELKTSLGNINKIPRGLNLIYQAGYKRAINYGCGLGYENHTKHFCGLMDLINYDPFIKGISMKPNSNFHNRKKPDVVVCNNVLNVIEDDKIINEVLDDLESYGLPVYITIYEGNGSGVGAKTKTGTYQRNMKTKEYKVLKERGYEYKNKAWIRGE